MIVDSVVITGSVFCSCIVNPAYGRAFLFMYKVLMEGIVGKRMVSTSLDADVINFLGIRVNNITISEIVDHVDACKRVLG